MKKLLIGLLFVLSGASNATVIQMDEGDLYRGSYGYGNMGTGRGIGFDVTSDFHMSSLGMDLGVQASGTVAAYEFEIFSSSDGHTANTLLDSRQFSLTEGEGWVDIAFDFDYLAGYSYVVNFSRVDDVGLAGIATMYSLEPSSHFDYGLLSTVEGFEGATPNNSNSLSAHFRITATQSVPEPAGIALLGLGLIGLALSRKGQRS